MSINKFIKFFAICYAMLDVARNSGLADRPRHPRPPTFSLQVLRPCTPSKRKPNYPINSIFSSYKKRTTHRQCNFLFLSFLKGVGGKLLARSFPPNPLSRTFKKEHARTLYILFLKFLKIHKKLFPKSFLCGAWGRAP